MDGRDLDLVGRLCGGPFLGGRVFPLQAVQIIRRPLRVARRREDKALIVLQHLE